jgi:hypothetical protein
VRSAQVSAPANTSVWRRLAVIGALLAICASLALSYVVGGRMRTQMHGLAAEAIAQENIAFCGKFGVGPGTAAHADCVEGLSALRTRHEQRMQIEAEAFPLNNQVP